MKISITNESGDWKEMLYTKDIVAYDVKNQEILDFFAQLSVSYSNNENMDKMYECLYNLINYGYLYTDAAEIDYNNYDYDDRLGYLGSSNWEELGLLITNADTDEIIYMGKIS